MKSFLGVAQDRQADMVIWMSLIGGVGGHCKVAPNGPSDHTFCVLNGSKGHLALLQDLRMPTFPSSAFGTDNLVTVNSSLQNRKKFALSLDGSFSAKERL